jgi:hypothetical protein
MTNESGLVTHCRQAAARFASRIYATERSKPVCMCSKHVSSYAFHVPVRAARLIALASRYC